MGKLGVVGLTVAAVVVAALLPSREAGAQDFGQAWIDRVTHELQQERGPLQAKPVTYGAEAGVEYAYDNNIFLTQDNKTKDSIIIPFVQANIEYGEPRFELEARLLADYKRYIKETNVSGDEERVFLHGRQTSSRWNFEISEIFQHVTDPAGIQFLARAERIISNTVPKIAFDIGNLWAVELASNVQVVRFKHNPYDVGQDNNNFNVDVTGVYRTPWAFDLLAQFGYYNINYIDTTDQGGTPDAFGYYYRVGFRGNVVQRLYLEGLIGYTNAKSDFLGFASNGNPDQVIDKKNVGALFNLRYELTETINLFVDGSRQYTFAGFLDPYQLLSSIMAYGTIDLTETFKLALRLQYENSTSALNLRRNYYAAGLTGTYKILSNLVVDAGATYRSGKTDNTNGEAKFNDFILSVGLALSW